MKKDDFGTRMKLYEGFETERYLIPLLPICIRIDGVCFSSFTKGMKRPYDIIMSKIMVKVTKLLVEETNACIGYTQSDEISLVLYSNDIKSQVFFNGKKHKLVSFCAGKASSAFQFYLSTEMPDKMMKLPTFDCRVWNVPNKTEAANTILWREGDSSKNSISIAAQEYFSHKQLDNKTGKQKQEMLFQKEGINWNDYPDFFKRGTFIQRKSVTRKFTTEEIEKLPLKHEARKNPDLMVQRSEIMEVSMPPFSKVTNRVEVIFDGEDPITKGDKS